MIPPCFTPEEWNGWMEHLIEEKDKREAIPKRLYCQDCTKDYERRMTAEGRCLKALSKPILRKEYTRKLTVLKTEFPDEFLGMRLVLTDPAWKVALYEVDGGNHRYLSLLEITKGRVKPTVHFGGYPMAVDKVPTISDLAEGFGMHRNTVLSRMMRGETVESMIYRGRIKDSTIGGRA